MAEAPGVASRKILLVASDAAEDTRRALSHGGYEVLSAGWLDAVTSARVARPAAIVLGGAIPAGGLATLVGAFSTPEFSGIRLVVPADALAHLPGTTRARVDATAEPGDRAALLSTLEGALAAPPRDLQAAVRAAALADLGLTSRLGRLRFAFGTLWFLAGGFQMTMTIVAAARKTERIAAAGRPATLAMAVGMLGFGLMSFPEAKGRWRRLWYGFLAAIGAAMLALAFFVPPP